MQKAKLVNDLQRLGWTTREIADALGVTPDAVRKARQRSRDRAAEVKAEGRAFAGAIEGARCSS